MGTSSVRALRAATSCSGVQQAGGRLVAVGYGSSCKDPSPMPDPTLKTLSCPAGAGSLQVCVSGFQSFPSHPLLLLSVFGCWSIPCTPNSPLPHPLCRLPQGSSPLLLQVTTRGMTSDVACHPNPNCRLDKKNNLKACC